MKTLDLEVVTCPTVKLPLRREHWSLRSHFFVPAHQMARRALTPPTSANIAITTIRPLTIAVDEVKETAWIDAGIRLNDALDYLRNFVTQNAPRGWTLGAQPICIGQSVGGAVSTRTHGSSLVHGSLSKQVLGIHVVFANGTAGEITPESQPLFMKVLPVWN